jgi:acyl-CoA synthetase (AMP-forming)/AMP-acid ligase II
VRDHYELFAAAAARSLDKTAVIDASGEISYSELERLACRKASSLRGLIENGSSIAVEVDNTIKSVVLLLALWALRAKPALVQMPKAWVYADSAVAHAERYGFDFGIDSLGRLTTIKSDSNAAELDSGADSYFLTSGTTGIAKLVMHTQRSLLAGLVGMLALQREEIGRDSASPSMDDLSATASWFEESYLDLRFATHMPISSIAGFTLLQRALLTGESLVLLEPSAVSEIISTIQRHRVTNLSLTPFSAHRILRTCGQIESHSLVAVGIGGSFVAPELVRGIERAFGCLTLSGYGLTETGGPVLLPRAGDPLDRRASSVGTPLPGVSVYLSPMGAEGVGRELIVESASVMLGYHGEPRCSTNPGDSARQLGTGDLAEQDSWGNWRIIGRKSRLIMRGSQRIDPLEIESVLRRHPLVVDVAVVGRPSRIAGEDDVIAIVESSSDELVRIREWCQTKLPANKVPRRILRIAEFQRHADGEIDLCSLDNVS